MNRSRPLHVRPILERLEPRLPPGDALLGILLAWPELTAKIPEPHDDLNFGFGQAHEETPAFAISHPDDVVNAELAAVPGEPTTDTQTSHSVDGRAAGLIPAVRTAGINTATRSAGVFKAERLVMDTPFTVRNQTRTDGGHSGGLIGAPLLALRAPIHTGPTLANGTTEIDESHVRDNYGNLPLTFEANHGQTDSRVDFIARTGGATVFLTPTAAVFALQGSGVRGQGSEELYRRAGRVNALDAASPQGVDTPRSQGVALYMEIVGANPSWRAAGVNPLETKVNYFIGNDPSQWHSNIPTFGRVEYQDVYPGIDVAYYGGQSRDGNGAGLEYDFIVSPGTDPSAITLNFAGADDVEINPQGDLVLHTAAGDVVQQKPFTYQEVGNTRQEVASGYVVDGTQVRFEVGAYDATRPLVVDPLVMGYSTYLGGPGGQDEGWDIAVDDPGNAYVTGHTGSSHFPITPGAYDTTYGFNNDAFVAKLNTSGSSLSYATYLGGNQGDFGHGIAVDKAGSAYVTGYTSSSDFATTSSSFDPTFNGNVDAFLVKLNSTGSGVEFGTYLGGASTDIGFGVDVDRTGKAFVTGRTASGDFPTTPGAFDPNGTGAGNYNAFAIKTSIDGSSLSYGTYLAGSAEDLGYAVAVDLGGSAYVTGFTGSNNFPTTPGTLDTSYNGGSGDSFVAKLSADGSSLDYGTFLGGPFGTLGDYGYAIAVDTAGHAFVTGFTTSPSFPTTPGAFDTTFNGDVNNFDAFVVQLSIDATSLVYGTYLGGFKDDFATGISIDRTGNAYLIGYTNATDFPTTPGTHDATYNGGVDAFMVKFNESGSSLSYSTYLGGPQSEGELGVDRSIFGIDVDAAGSAYVVGWTDSTNFPTTPGSFKPRSRGGREGFVTKFAET